MHQLRGYKFEEKIYLGARERERFNITALRVKQTTNRHMVQSEYTASGMWWPSRPAPPPARVLSQNVIGEIVNCRVTRKKSLRLCLSLSSLELYKYLSVAGDRKYNIPPLSPLLIKEIDVSQGNGLTIKIKDANIYGLLGASVEKLKYLVLFVCLFVCGLCNDADSRGVGTDVRWGRAWLNTLILQPPVQVRRRLAADSAHSEVKSIQQMGTRMNTEFGKMWKDAVVV